MQIKYNFSVLIFLCAITTCFCQVSWVLPLSPDQVAVGKEDALYFTVDKKTSICFDKSGQKVDLGPGIKSALGKGLFLLEKDTLLGVVEAGKGVVIPPAYEKIEMLGSHFFLVTNYGATALLNKSHEVLINYQFKPMIPVLKGEDTLLMKFSMHPDAKAQGFLKNGKTLDEASATALYPKDRRSLSAKPAAVPPSFSLFFEKGKTGIKTVSGEVVVPAEYDEIRFGYPGYFAVKKDKAWGLIHL